MDDLHLADALAANVSAGIECAQLLRKQRDLFLDTITILAQAVELRDEYTGGHTYRVTTYSMLLAEKLEMSPDDMDLIRIGTPLHDIGKIGIDDAILRKPDKLTPEEFEIMKTHTVKGAEIIATVPDLRPIIPIVRSHHERWDGRGYPDGLGGEAISPAGPHRGPGRRLRRHDLRPSLPQGHGRPRWPSPRSRRWPASSSTQCSPPPS